MARRSLVLDQAVESEGKKKKSRKKLIVGIAMLGVVPLVGSTLAASINLGSGSIEFGQGYRAVAACDSSINIALTSTYSSASNFTVSTVALTNIDSACGTLTVKLYDASGNQLGSTLTGTEASNALTLTPSNVNAQDVAMVTVESS